MPTRRHVLSTGAALLALAATGLTTRRTYAAAPQAEFEVHYSEAEWRTRLSPQQYAVLREQATEPPGSSPLDKEYGPGQYNCAGCGLPLFSSSTKFNSHTGWPSFWEPLENAVGTHTDMAYGMMRTEVHCRRCGGHLGHVFNDGPPPTGLRYCMNGLSLTFQPQPA